MKILLSKYPCLKKAVNIYQNRSLFTQTHRLGLGISRVLPGALPTTQTEKLKMSSTHGNPLDAVDDVDIDASGKFKYVLIKIWPKDDKNNSKFIVRGYRWAEYHADIFDEVESKLIRQKISCDCYGGGRIEHTPGQKTILVYGYSQGFGRADHSIAVEKLQARYPDYVSITSTNDGY